MATCRVLSDVIKPTPTLPIGTGSAFVGAGRARWRAAKRCQSHCQVIKLETIFSRPAQDCPVPVAVVFVYFHLDTSTGALTYQFEEENVQHEAGRREGKAHFDAGACASRRPWFLWAFGLRVSMGLNLIDLAIARISDTS